MYLSTALGVSDTEWTWHKWYDYNPNVVSKGCNSTDQADKSKSSCLVNKASNCGHCNFKYDYSLKCIYEWLNQLRKICFDVSMSEIVVVQVIATIILELCQVVRGGWGELHCGS